MYMTKDITRLFGISAQSVRTYATEFAEYFSPTATPETGSQRNFSEDDLAVFALVVESKRLGKTYAQIHIDLAAGQRGNPPNTSPVTRPDSTMVQLRQDLLRLQQEFSKAQTELLRTEGENRLLKEQLREKDEQIRDLYMTIARIEAEQKD